MSNRLVVICHFYNEEYLLPSWLKHHKDVFDFGIMIDYNSNDLGPALINSICPNWKLVKSENQFFDAELVDLEVEKYEGEFEGWVIALNVTEFLLGDLTIFHNTNKSRLYIPSIALTSTEQNTPNEYLDFNSVIKNDKNVSINFWKHPEYRKSRCIHKDRFKYPIGRHFMKINQSSLIIVHVANYLVNQNMVLRRLQIQDRIPMKDRVKRFGQQHYGIDGNNLVISDLLENINKLKKYTSNSETVLNYFIKLKNGKNPSGLSRLRVKFLFCRADIILRLYRLKLAIKTLTIKILSLFN
jgi:hypothetical protein